MRFWLPARENNPVILFEHKGLYRRGKHPVSFDPDYRKVWHPRRVREGSYATLVTYGEMHTWGGGRMRLPCRRNTRPISKVRPEVPIATGPLRDCRVGGTQR